MGTQLSIRALEHWKERHRHRSLLNDKEWREVFELAIKGKNLAFALDALWAIGELDITTLDNGMCRVIIEPAENHHSWAAEGKTLAEALLNLAEPLRQPPEIDRRQAILVQKQTA